MTPVFAPASRGALLLRMAILAVALVTTFVLAAVLLWRPDLPMGSGWVRGPAMSVVRQRGVVPLPFARAYVVAAGPSRPIALYAKSPQLGERVRYCPRSGWFEDARHGSKFDRLGRYAFGPAPRGMDRFGVRVIRGVVWIDTAQIFLGPPRGAPTLPPTGRFCSR
jgi:hypothetical protein